MPQAKRYQLNGKECIEERQEESRGLLVFNKLLPGEEPPLVTSAIASTLLAALLAVNWVLIVVATVFGGVLAVCGSVVIAAGGGVIVAAGGSGVVAGGGSVIAAGVVVASIVVVTIAANSEVNSIIHGSTLGNWHNDALVVRSGGDRREPICTSREAVGNIGSKLAIGSNTVETLEERKDTRVCGLRRTERWDRFNDDVVVSDNLPGIIQLLRCSEVGGVSVGEVSSLHPLCVQDNGERSVGVHVTAIGRELELAGRHIVDTRNITHWRRVARATLDLQTVCDSLADTEVDEVVGTEEGVCFTCSRTCTIDLLNDRGVQSKGGLRVPVLVATAVLIVVCTSGTVVATILGVVSAVLVVVATVLVIVSTFQSVVAPVAAKPIVLTRRKAMRLWDEEGGRELSHDKESERDPEALHGNGKRWMSGSGKNDGVESKRAPLSKRL